MSYSLISYYQSYSEEPKLTGLRSTFLSFSCSLCLRWFLFLTISRPDLFSPLLSFSLSLCNLISFHDSLRWITNSNLELLTQVSALYFWLPTRSDISLWIWFRHSNSRKLKKNPLSFQPKPALPLEPLNGSPNLLVYEAWNRFFLWPLSSLPLSHLLSHLNKSVLYTFLKYGPFHMVPK